MNQLDLGESETIILAKEVQADLVIIDENIGYMIAENSGLNVVRTLSVLLKAKEKGIETVVFDRNGFLYHGRVKNLADAARESGLKL